jgi:hypothetical protein
MILSTPASRYFHLRGVSDCAQVGAGGHDGAAGRQILSVDFEGRIMCKHLHSPCACVHGRRWACGKCRTCGHGTRIGVIREVLQMLSQAAGLRDGVPASQSPRLGTAGVLEEWGTYVAWTSSFAGTGGIVDAVVGVAAIVRDVACSVALFGGVFLRERRPMLGVVGGEARECRASRRVCRRIGCGVEGAGVELRAVMREERWEGRCLYGVGTELSQH